MVDFQLFVILFRAHYTSLQKAMSKVQFRLVYSMFKKQLMTCMDTSNFFLRLVWVTIFEATQAVIFTTISSFMAFIMNASQWIPNTHHKPWELLITVSNTLKRMTTRWIFKKKKDTLPHWSMKRKVLVSPRMITVIQFCNIPGWNIHIENIDLEGEINRKLALIAIFVSIIFFGSVYLSIYMNHILSSARFYLWKYLSSVEKSGLRM